MDPEKAELIETKRRLVVTGARLGEWGDTSEFPSEQGVHTAQGHGEHAGKALGEQNLHTLATEKNGQLWEALEASLTSCGGPSTVCTWVTSSHCLPSTYTIPYVSLHQPNWEIGP